MSKKNEKNDLHIYILDRGMVRIGRARPHLPGDDPSIYILDDVATVRRWGTTRGLGQLAQEGPIEDKTKLDVEPDGVEIYRRGIQVRIPCTGAWTKSFVPKA